MRILCLDPSTVSGYAHGNPELDLVPMSGTFALPTKESSISKRMVLARQWAIRMIEEQRITSIYAEAPILPRFATSIDSVMNVAGIAFVFGMAACEMGIGAMLIDSQSWRSELGLPTRGPKNVLADPVYQAKFGKRKNGLSEAKRAYLKDAAMKFAVMNGSKPKDDNEGDAICIYHAMRARLLKRREATLI